MGTQAGLIAICQWQNSKPYLLVPQTAAASTSFIHTELFL